MTVSLKHAFQSAKADSSDTSLIRPSNWNAERDGVEQIEGLWFTRYVLGPVFKNYTDAEGVLHTAAEQEAAYRAGKDAEQAASVRAQRNQRLNVCDWTQLNDAPLTNVQQAAWATYRQALRDITTQPGFPWSIEWPTPPAP